MTHETAVLLALACEIVEAEGANAAIVNDRKAILDAATSAASLRHVIEYIVKGEESYGRS